MDKFVIRTKRNIAEKDNEKGGSPRVKFRAIEKIESSPHSSGSSRTAVKWTNIRKENLNCDYCMLFKKCEADNLLKRCESDLHYLDGQLAKVQVYGKWYNIPRKQMSYGDAGLTYTFSGITVPAKPWIPVVQDIKQKIEEVTGHRFNFVLINRYKDGNDHMGEHKDDEKDLVPDSPIASLSLGQQRDFIFRHGDSRGKNASRKIDPVKLELQHGSLLVMNYPTNVYWYHSLPVRKKALGVRINMTFRQMKVK